MAESGQTLWSHSFEKVMPVYGDYGESKKYIYAWFRLPSGTVIRRILRFGLHATNWNWRKFDWNYQWTKEWDQVDPFPTPIDGLGRLIEDSDMSPQEAERLLNEPYDHTDAREEEE